MDKEELNVKKNDNEKNVREEKEKRKITEDELKEHHKKIMRIDGM